MDLIAHPAPSPFELGTRIGQAQAFRWIAKRSSAAGARQLKQIKEDRSYESLGLTWDQFCSQHAGISRAYADRLIKRLEEFGEPYFQLSGIARVSPESYRLLAPAVTPGGIEVDGESIPLTPENAPRIRKAVAALRDQLSQARRSTPDPDITEMLIRFDACFYQMARLVHSPNPGTRAALRGLIHYSRGKLQHLETAMGPQ